MVESSYAGHLPRLSPSRGHRINPAGPALPRVRDKTCRGRIAQSGDRRRGHCAYRIGPAGRFHCSDFGNTASGTIVLPHACIRGIRSGRVSAKARGGVYVGSVWVRSSCFAGDKTKNTSWRRDDCIETDPGAGRDG